MELAATENAKVCTSVCIRYLAVASSRLRERRFSRGGREIAGFPAGVGAVGMGGFGTAESEIVADEQGIPGDRRNGSVSDRLPSYFLIYVKVIGKMTRGHV